MYPVEMIQRIRVNCITPPRALSLQRLALQAAVRQKGETQTMCLSFFFFGQTVALSRKHYGFGGCKFFVGQHSRLFHLH